VYALHGQQWRRENCTSIVWLSSLVVERWNCNQEVTGLTLNFCDVKYSSKLLSHTCLCHQAVQCSTIAEGQWCSEARKVTVSLALHWPSDTDTVVNTIYGLKAYERKMTRRLFSLAWTMEPHSLHLNLALVENVDVVISQSKQPRPLKCKQSWDAGMIQTAECFLKLREAELTQYRSRFLPGPSSNTWPRCEPHRLQETSTREIPTEKKFIYCIKACQ